ncbi:MAG: hypothetical protein R3313_00350 [Candidatus Saccharimonadales bacterium]|nr:hypothetical protein [Candidatus Saccharimonadales bacterium]
MNESDKQTSKIFYIPIIYNGSKDSSHEQILTYVLPDQEKHEDYYASKVLPGQSLREAVQNDLKTDFNYEGSFDIDPSITFVDEIPGKNGQYSKRYEVSITLLNNLDISQAKPLGCNVEWHPLNEGSAQEQVDTDSVPGPTSSRQLSLKDVDELEKLLGVTVDRQKLYPKEIWFEELSFNPKITVGDDWKWDDLHVINSIKEAAPELEIEYDSRKDFTTENRKEEGYSNIHDYMQSFDIEIWHMNFKMLGKMHEISFKRLEIEVLIEEVNKVLKKKFDKNFIEIDTFSDYVLYLLVPLDFDKEKLESIIYNFD